MLIDDLIVDFFAERIKCGLGTRTGGEKIRGGDAAPPLVWGAEDLSSLSDPG
jgi:hypothetical protein